MRATLALLLVLCSVPMARAQSGPPAERLRWSAGSPLLGPFDRDGDHYFSVKDPTVVRYLDRWHVFCTIRGEKRSHQIEYFSFRDWKDAARADRHILKLTDGYFCAPQVFYFTPHKKWYLIYQVGDKSRKPTLQPAFSTAADITKPSSWTPPELLFTADPEGVTAWIDFWIICDDAGAHLFFTSLNGKMWRSDAPLKEFPHGWGTPKLVLEADIFEASHTYRLKGQQKYLTLVEAQGEGGRRYYKSYEAGRLDGAWTPLAAPRERPFASPVNIEFGGTRWTDSFSHGELIRDGYDETLTVDPARLEFLFQGVSDEDRRGKPYGQIPWRLGLLKLVP